MNKVIELQITNNYSVNVKFKDGFEGEIDLKPMLGKGIAEELLEEQKFKTLSIESGGGLAWKNGYDICPNYLRELVEKEVENKVI